jgi:tetratricopeptide (TPR) repeat protein
MKSFVSLILALVFMDLAEASPNLQEQLATETRRREQSIQPLQQALSQGEKLATQGETLRAWEGLNRAWEQTPEGLRSTSLGGKVQGTLAGWEAKLAETEARQSRWPKARDWALRCLQRQPDNASARAMLEEANTILGRGAVAGEEVNPALTNRFFEKLQAVQDGLKEAAQLRETGQLDQAEIRYEEVLKLDPFNLVATEGIRKIYEERSLVAAQSRDLSNLERKR